MDLSYSKETQKTDSDYRYMKEIQEMKLVSMEFDRTNGEIVITPRM